MNTGDGDSTSNIATVVLEAARRREEVVEWKDRVSIAFPDGCERVERGEDERISEGVKSDKAGRECRDI